MKQWLHILRGYNIRSQGYALKSMLHFYVKKNHVNGGLKNFFSFRKKKPVNHFDHSGTQVLLSLLTTLGRAFRRTTLGNMFGQKAARQNEMKFFCLKKDFMF